MCYYNGIRVSYQEFIRLKNMEKQLKGVIMTNAVTNGFNYGKVPIIKPNADYCDWDLVEMEWGFIPSYLRNREAVTKFRNGYMSDKGYQKAMITLNAIGEELLIKSMYQDAALKRRCLFLSTGFVEYRHLPKMGKKGQPLKTPEKYPYYIKVKDQEVFYFAGIWQEWTDKDTGEKVDTCALVTTEANSLMAQIHNSKNRMPCILDEEKAGRWISDGLSEPEIIHLASQKFPADRMEAWTIDKEFKKHLEQTEHVKYSEVPELVLS